MDIQPLRIAGAWRISPQIFADTRGSFSEWFHADKLEAATGFRLNPVQANISQSSRGVLRGIHYADVPPGQAKYVMPVSGSIIDFVVDIREGSPTFGQWEGVRLDSENRDAIFIEPGLGHAFMALDDLTTVTYLVTDIYRPDREHGINPLDRDIALTFPTGIEPVLSGKDSSALSLADALTAGSLPKWEGR